MIDVVVVLIIIAVLVGVAGERHPRPDAHEWDDLHDWRRRIDVLGRVHRGPR